MGLVDESDIVARLDQSIADFKSFVSQRFRDQDKLNQLWQTSNNRLLDERFATQTKALDAAFANQQLAMAAALQTANDASQRTDLRIKAIEDRQNEGSGRSAGLRDGWGYLVGAVGALATIVSVLIVVIGSR